MIDLLELSRRQNDDLFRRCFAECESRTIQERRWNFVCDEPEVGLDGGAS